MTYMTKQDIISYVYDLKIVDKLAKRYRTNIGENNIDDFKQTIYCMLLNMTEAQLVSLYERNELVYYIMAIVRNQCVNKKSTFNRMYNEQNIDYVESVENVSELYDI